MTGPLRLPLHRDERGDLVVVDFADVSFDVRRVFTVTGVPDGVSRGGHRAGCRELLVLVSGRLWLEVEGARTTLEDPGDAWEVAPDDHVTYGFHGDDGVLLVLADRPWRPQAER